MGLLEGKIVLVTGSGRGIGAAIVVRCAREGAKVVINYLQDREMAEKTLSLVRDNSGDGIIVKADVRKNEEGYKLISETIQAYGGINVLINCAHTPFKPTLFANLAWHDIMGQLEGILASSFYCVQHAMPYLERSSSGVVLNISSVTVRIPEEGFSHRNIAKAALEGMTRSLAYEYANRGVRVNALTVGWTETDQLKCFPQEYLLSKKAGIPMHRFAAAEEIADAALFLISSLSKYVTGTVFPVTGGLWSDLA
jgi:3-oxoacyl-[acyl-carrier protein] reductase